MKSIRSTAAFERAMADPMDPDLRRLLILRRDQLLNGGDADLGAYVQFILVGQGDTLADVEEEAGFPLTGDEAPIEWVETGHPGGFVEAAIMAADDFAIVIFLQNCLLTDTALLLALLARA